MKNKYNVLFLLMFLTSLASAQTSLPVSMIIEGTIGASSDGKLVPLESDRIVVSVASSGLILPADGTIGGGSYGVSVSQAASFNGTNIGLLLKRGTVTYQLRKSDGTAAVIGFNGAVLPLGRTVMDLVATSLIVSGGTTTGGTTGGGTTGGGTTGGGTAGNATAGDPSLRAADFNSDGRVNEADIERLKQALAGRIPINKTAMDVNNDGVVNSRDLIDLIRAVRAQARQNLKPASILPPR